jgi:UDP-3-O-[3-hydroxymyristoyl] glucosamine N-acyltransferase
MSKNLYLVGAGGYGKQLYSLLKKNNIVHSIKFVDDKTNLTIDNFFKKKKRIDFNITIGSPKIRENIYLQSLKTKFIFKTLIFPNKNIYSGDVDMGCVIEPNTLISNNVSIGLGSFVFFGSSIAHDVTVGNFCNIGCNCSISGNVHIGDRVQVGANTFISNNISICSDAIITPGSIIIKDIKKKGIYKDNFIIK